MREAHKEYKRLMEKVNEYGVEMEKEDYYYLDSIDDKKDILVHGTYIG